MYLFVDNVLMKVLNFCIGYVYLGEGMVIFFFYGIFIVVDFIVI